MTRPLRLTLAGALALGLIALGVACNLARGTPEPDRVVVQQILVSFAGKVPGKVIARQQAEANKLAQKVMEIARGGQDFDALAQQYSDDKTPGRYTIVNRGRVPAANEYGRDQMVPGFGDVAFELKVGQVGLCSFDGVRSPFGFHVIKRLE
jgi:PPIC-type PPIASE domain